MELISCETCKFQREQVCHRYPPTVVSISVRDNYNTWHIEPQDHRPSAYNAQWCGEWAAP